ncbi:hypothetical protein TgHK011_009241 [Trichoderma gracile]|nr:hypothetical protein TgHK011_009241 [Trichoderma gracile]
MFPPKTGTMAQAPDHGGLHYIELIKSNLQFIHGRDCLFEVLSHMKGPDNWQVSVLKTNIITPRTTLFFDTGPSLIEVLAKLHRRSAEMLASFLGDDAAAEASAFAKRKKVDALAQPQQQQKKKNELPKKEVERSRNGVEKPPNADEEEAKAAAVAARAHVAVPLGTDDLHLREAASPSLVRTGRGSAAPGRFRGWRSPSPPPREEDFEPVSRYEDSSLRPRGFICPNYGPASAFYRVSEGHSEAYSPIPMPVKPLKQKAEVSKPEAGGSVPPPAASASTAIALAQPQPSSQVDEGKQVNKSNVLLYISWPSYGSTIVADQCELSVRSLQGRVRHMLRCNGPALFGDALVGAQAPVVFGPDEVASFAVQIKGLRVNEQVVMLGPAFGDDLEQVVKGRAVEGAIRVEVELLWKGRDLRAGAAK